MNNYFDNILTQAILRCDGCYPIDSRNGFFQIYPFTTENISGYIKHFDLKDKSLMTVGSSGDQVINAYFNKCNDITVIDICPFTKFYFYLKIAGIIVFDYDTFLNFFCYRDFPKIFYDNKNSFDLNNFIKLKPVLRLLDYESYLFWDELFSLYDGIKIRRKLFDHEEKRLSVLSNANLYMSNKENFDICKKNILNIRPNFIIDDISNVNIDKFFDNIWLSNLGKYLTLDKLKKLIDKLYPHLNDDGNMLVCYLYEFIKDTKYEKGWLDIYNSKKVLSYFKDYDLELISFLGIKDFIFESNSNNDSIWLCKKRKKD